MKHLESINNFNSVNTDKDIQIIKDVFDSFEEDYTEVFRQTDTIVVRIESQSSQLKDELKGYLDKSETFFSIRIPNILELLEKLNNQNKVLRRIYMLTGYKITYFSKIGDVVIMIFNDRNKSIKESLTNTDIKDLDTIKDILDDIELEYNILELKGLNIIRIIVDTNRGSNNDLIERKAGIPSPSNKLLNGLKRIKLLTEFEYKSIAYLYLNHYSLDLIKKPIKENLTNTDLSVMNDDQRTIIDLLDDLDLEFNIWILRDNYIRILIDHSKEVNRNIESELKKVDKRIKSLTGYTCVRISRSTKNGEKDGLCIDYNNYGDMSIFESKNKKIPSDHEMIIDILEDYELEFDYIPGYSEIEFKIKCDAKNNNPLIHQILETDPKTNMRMFSIESIKNNPVMKRISKLTGYYPEYVSIHRSIENVTIFLGLSKKSNKIQESNDRNIPTPDHEIAIDILEDSELDFKYWKIDNDTFRITCHIGKNSNHELILKLKKLIDANKSNDRIKIIQKLRNYDPLMIRIQKLGGYILEFYSIINSVEKIAGKVDTLLVNFDFVKYK